MISIRVMQRRRECFQDGVKEKIKRKVKKRREEKKEMGQNIKEKVGENEEKEMGRNGGWWSELAGAAAVALRAVDCYRSRVAASYKQSHPEFAGHKGPRRLLQLFSPAKRSHEKRLGYIT